MKWPKGLVNTNDDHYIKPFSWWRCKLKRTYSKASLLKISNIFGFVEKGTHLNWTVSLDIPWCRFFSKKFLHYYKDSSACSYWCHLGMCTVKRWFKRGFNFISAGQFKLVKIICGRGSFGNWIHLCLKIIWNQIRIVF